MNVKGKKLFRYSSQMIKYWEEQDSAKFWTHYADYQVARFYEDLLSILPDVLQPIPQELCEYIQTLEKQLEFEYKTKTTVTDEEDWWSDYQNAVRWLWCRTLPGGHMITPSVYFFRCCNSIRVRGDNLDNKIDNIDVWTENEVEASFTVKEFLDELHAFHNNLMNQMETRIQTITTRNPSAHIYIDVEQLLAEHEQRKLSLEKALNKSPTVLDWSLVTSAIDKLGVV